MAACCITVWDEADESCKVIHGLGQYATECCNELHHEDEVSEDMVQLLTKQIIRIPAGTQAEREAALMQVHKATDYYAIVWDEATDRCKVIYGAGDTHKTPTPPVSIPAGPPEEREAAITQLRKTDELCVLVKDEADGLCKIIYSDASTDVAADPVTKPPCTPWSDAAAQRYGLGSDFTPDEWPDTPQGTRSTVSRAWLLAADQRDFEQYFPPETPKP
jgi:hypothetical protein